MADNWHDKGAATRIGVSLEEYQSRQAIGEKWCTLCKAWHSRQIFTIDRSRYDGLTASCRGYKPSLMPKSTDELRLQANAGYRRYYAGPAGERIRAQKYARKRQCEPVVPRDREQIFDSFLGMCAYCGEPASTVDHALAVTKGGGSRRGNILPACVSCNSRKNTKSLDDFLRVAVNPNLDLIINELSMAEVL